jgi:Zn-dependent membrane protease YugP
LKLAHPASYCSPVLTTLTFLSLGLMALSFWAQWRVKGTFAANNQVPLRSGVTGADAAALIMRAAGVRDVTIEAVPGMLSDHYDPTRKVVALSEEVLHGRTAAAVAVAAHEVGHVLQDVQGYQPMALRAQIVPLASFANGLAFPLLLVGMLSRIPALMWIGVLGFAFGVVFHLVTLPVEFDASRRAMRILEQSGIVAADEMPGVRKTLFAAGFTYLAGALYAVVELLRLLMATGILGGSSEE